MLISPASASSKRERDYELGGPSVDLLRSVPTETKGTIRTIPSSPIARSKAPGTEEGPQASPPAPTSSAAGGDPVTVGGPTASVMSTLPYMTPLASTPLATTAIVSHRARVRRELLLTEQSCVIFRNSRCCSVSDLPTTASSTLPASAVSAIAPLPAQKFRSNAVDIDDTISPSVRHSDPGA